MSTCPSWLLLAAPLLLLAAAGPTCAQGVPKSLIEKDRLQLLVDIAEGQFQGGNVDGAKCALLALIPMVPPPQMPGRPPDTKARMYANQLRKLSQVMPVVYKDHQYAGDLTTFAEVVKTHLPEIKKHAEIMNLPPLAHTPTDYTEYVRMLVEAKRGATDAATAVKAYARLAPGYGDHLQVLQNGTILAMMAQNGQPPTDPKHVQILEVAAPMNELLGAMQKVLFGLLFVDRHLKDDVMDRNLAAIHKAMVGFDAQKLAEALDANKLEATASEIERYGRFVLWAEPENAEVKALVAKTPEWRKLASEARGKRIAQNRLPNESYKGTDAAELRTLITGLWEKKFPKETVMRVLLTSQDWVEEHRAEWKRDYLTWRRYRFLPQCAISVEYHADDGTKKYLVHFFVLERLWSGSDFGSPYLYQPLGFFPYQVTKENAT